MLDSLDTLIAFALIFTVVSLLITIVVQMITSLLNLRGKNLAWGIAEAFEAIAPDLKATAQANGKKLADYLLRDPLLSDSQIGTHIGTAKAVRAKELYALLHRIATGKKHGTPDDIKNDVVTLFKGLGVPASVFELLADEKKRLEDLKADVTNQLTALPDGPAKKQLQNAKAEAEAKLANAAAYAADSASRWAAQGEAEIQKVYQRFEQWFETGQERSQEWFTTHARIITGILGLIAAFALQLDTIEIYKLVSSNREVRASLVAQVKPVIDQGEKILKESPTVMKASFDSLGRVTNTTTGIIASNALSKGVQIAATDTPERVKAKIRTAYTNTYLDTLDAALKEVPDQEEAGKRDHYRKQLEDSFNNWVGALDAPSLVETLKKENIIADKEVKKAEFRQRVAKVLLENLDTILQNFDQETVKEVQARMKISSEEWTALKSSLDNSGFDLFPKDGWRWIRKDEQGKILERFWWNHLFGMLLSALLLSLGAPFWFNTLKSFASLRSSVAKNISDEDKAELKNTKADQRSKLPPTVT